MSYTQLVKQWKKESEKKNKQEREERKRQQEKSEKFKDAIYLAKGIQEKQEQKEMEDKQERVLNAKRNILNVLQSNNPFTYPQYLIIWDVLNYDYNQIMSSLKRNKITKSDIAGALEYIKNFSNDIVSAYWEETLLSV